MGVEPTPYDPGLEPECTQTHGRGIEPPRIIQVTRDRISLVVWELNPPYGHQTPYDMKGGESERNRTQYGSYIHLARAVPKIVGPGVEPVN